MREIFLIITILITVSANAVPDCSEVDDFKTSIHGILESELLPINVDTPREDAKIRLKNGDFRLLGYGMYSGIQIPGSDLLGKKICAYGIRILPGMTDSYESSNHRILVEKLKIYIGKYNNYVLTRINGVRVD